jgi:hypothetical protein
MFIDKYTQIFRILGPVIHTIENIDNLDEFIGTKSVEEAKIMILQDFFKHGFDGSGADNFFDAGSCIDGRLTSLWNWSSKLERKEYFNLFLLSGFIGFDGEF